jgi:hypothetical protein
MRSGKSPWKSEENSVDLKFNASKGYFCEPRYRYHNGDRIGKLFFGLEPQLKRFRAELDTSRHYGPIEVEAGDAGAQTDRAVIAQNATVYIRFGTVEFKRF